MRLGFFFGGDSASNIHHIDTRDEARRNRGQYRQAAGAVLNAN